MRDTVEVDAAKFPLHVRISPATQLNIKHHCQCHNRIEFDGK